MKRMFSGMGMGMVAGMCVGVMAAGLLTDQEKRRVRRKAGQAARELSDAAEAVRGGRREEERRKNFPAWLFFLFGMLLSLAVSACAYFFAVVR